MSDDPFLKKRLARYDRWLGQGKISHSARVVPVKQSLRAVQWVLPGERALQIVQAADTVAVQHCECRMHYNRCDNPREVCLLFDAVADGEAAHRRARRVSIGEAEAILAKADAAGLVHLSLYRPDHTVYALCSCCTCCCHDLQIVRQYGRSDLVKRSGYVAVTDQTICTQCGVCVERCVFDARRIEDERLTSPLEACLGCGLCVSACPEGAIAMKLRDASPGERVR